MIMRETAGNASLWSNARSGAQVAASLHQVLAGLLGGQKLGFGSAAGIEGLHADSSCLCFLRRHVQNRYSLGFS